METLLLPFSPRFVVLTICAVATALLVGIAIADRRIFDILLVPWQHQQGMRLVVMPTVVPFKTAPDASIRETRSRVEHALKVLEGYPEIEHTYASIGAGDTDTTNAVRALLAAAAAPAPRGENR